MPDTTPPIGPTPSTPGGNHDQTAAAITTCTCLGPLNLVVVAAVTVALGASGQGPKVIRLITSLLGR